MVAPEREPGLLDDAYTIGSGCHEGVLRSWVKLDSAASIQGWERR